MSCDVFEFIQYVHYLEYPKLKFRPIQSMENKKRDEAINKILELVESAGPSAKQFAINLYDAIKSGDIKLSD